MAQLVLISAKTKKDWNNLNDVVVVFDDSVIPTDKEKEGYTIIQVPGTAEEVKAQIMAKVPRIELVWKDESDNTWKELKEEPSFQCKYEGGTFKHNYGTAKNIMPLNLAMKKEIK